jgi:hypothetical protein
LSPTCARAQLAQWWLVFCKKNKNKVMKAMKAMLKIKENESDK